MQENKNENLSRVQKAMEISQKLQGELEKLEKCKTLSKEDLQGRYKKAYSRLKQDIQNDTQELLSELVYKAFRYNPQHMTRANIDEIYELIESYSNKFSQALYSECSIDNFLNQVFLLMEDLKKYGEEHDNCTFIAIEKAM